MRLVTREVVTRVPGTAQEVTRPVTRVGVSRNATISRMTTASV